MDYGLIKASERLSELNIKVDQDGYAIDVYWFRVMFKEHDWLIRRHAHSTLEFHFIKSGDCTVELDDRSFIAREGTFFLTAPGVHHAQKPAASAELVEYSLNCDIRRAAPSADAVGDEMEWLESVFLTTPCAPTEDTSGVFALFEAALREADHSLPGFEMSTRSLLLQILVAAARSMKGHELPRRQAETDTGYDDQRMARLEQFVANNVRAEIGPSDLAALLNLSERQVGRIVQRCKGYSPKKFITRTRLKTAKRLLSTTDLTLKEIASELGFSSEYYFGSVFKKHEGYPPGMFRKSMRQDDAGAEAGAR